MSQTNGELPRWVRLLRDLLLALVPLGLIIYEIGWGGARPHVLVFLGALMSTPLVLRADESRRADRKDQHDPQRVD